MLHQLSVSPLVMSRSFVPVWQLESAEYGHLFHLSVYPDGCRSKLSFKICLAGGGTGWESLCCDVSEERDILAMGSARLLVTEDDDSVLTRGFVVVVVVVSWVCFGFCSN